MPAPPPSLAASPRRRPMRSAAPGASRRGRRARAERASRRRPPVQRKNAFLGKASLGKAFLVVAACGALATAAEGAETRSVHRRADRQTDGRTRERESAERVTRETRGRETEAIVKRVATRLVRWNKARHRKSLSQLQLSLIAHLTCTFDASHFFLILMSVVSSSRVIRRPTHRSARGVRPSRRGGVSGTRSMLRGAMSVTAALPAVPHAVARRAHPVRSPRWGGGGSSHRRHRPAVAERAWTTGPELRRRAPRASPRTAVGARSFRSSARLASSRDDDPGCAASCSGAKTPAEETADDATPRPRGGVRRECGTGYHRALPKLRNLGGAPPCPKF